MYTKFTTDFIHDGDTVPERDLAVIAKRYLKGDFIWDLIPLLPLSMIFEHTKSSKLFFILKTLRIINGIKLFKVSVILSNIKST